MKYFDASQEFFLAFCNNNKHQEYVRTGTHLMTFRQVELIFSICNIWKKVPISPVKDFSKRVMVKNSGNKTLDEKIALFLKQFDDEPVLA